MLYTVKYLLLTANCLQRYRPLAGVIITCNNVFDKMVFLDENRIFSRSTVQPYTQRWFQLNGYVFKVSNPTTSIFPPFLDGYIYV